MPKEEEDGEESRAPGASAAAINRDKDPGFALLHELIAASSAATYGVSTSASSPDQQLSPQVSPSVE